MIEQDIALKTGKSDDNIWETISKGQLPAGFKNRFAMLPELTGKNPGTFVLKTNGRDVRFSNSVKKNQVFLLCANWRKPDCRLLF